MLKTKRLMWNQVDKSKIILDNLIGECRGYYSAKEGVD